MGHYLVDVGTPVAGHRLPHRVVCLFCFVGLFWFVSFGPLCVSFVLFVVFVLFVCQGNKFDNVSDMPRTAAHLTWDLL